MRCTILDCYTDEPAGLGVPPYIGTYPRYIYGRLMLEGHDVQYITIDDLRHWKLFDRQIRNEPKTNIKAYNLTGRDAESILSVTEELYVICGAHVPGKYLSALPGTLHEVTRLLDGVKCKKILCGPAATEFGTRLEGGKKTEHMDISMFDRTEQAYAFSDIAAYSIKGAEVVRQIPYTLIAELETARGCPRRPGCSFCTEPLKSRHEFRNVEEIIIEAKELNAMGIRHFRLGKQSDFFSWKPADMKKMLLGIRELGVEMLHIDNVDPVNVTDEKVKLVVEHCTEGNVAALGIESFDQVIHEKNNLNSSPENSMRAIRLINKYGAAYGENGMPMFLPGVNILFGLNGETKNSHEENMKHFTAMLDEGLLVRRINVRQVAAFPGTQLYEECGDKFVRKIRSTTGNGEMKYDRRSTMSC